MTEPICRHCVEPKPEVERNCETCARYLKPRKDCAQCGGTGVTVRLGAKEVGQELPLYAGRNPWVLEPHYSRHVAAMTAEGLHSKADIAGELAFRDWRIKELEQERDAYKRAKEENDDRFMRER